MKRLGIDYGKHRNCFQRNEGIPSELIWGDLDYVKQPWISYIIPVYKRADLLAETIESVLKQKPVNFMWDIVVVDNETGGENDTERLIKNINNKRILYYRNSKNLGPDGNYNRCIELARGTWLAMLHADDLLMNDHLQLMGEYIKKNDKKRRPLAYISPRYQEFKHKGKISLVRKNPKKEVIEEKDKANVYALYNGKLKRFRQIDALLTGYSVGLPSFGTIMNKEIMLKCGGFDRELGICEDVIIPYRLARHNRVYMTPYVMGYYRFEGNESMKPETIFNICESMSDFREYMYSRNFLSRIWGWIARDFQFRSLTDYCTYISRFSSKRIIAKEFEYIHQPRDKKISKIFSTILFKLIMRIYAKLNSGKTYDKYIEEMVDDILPDIAKNNYAENIIIYGAGSAGRYTAKVLTRKYKRKVKCFAVTSIEENEREIMGIPVIAIDKLRSNTNDSLLILATTTPDFYDEMKAKAESCGFKNWCSLMQYEKHEFC